MRIQAINGSNYSVISPIKKSEQSINPKTNKSQNDSVSFGMRVWDHSKLRILERSWDELKDLAAYFNKSSDYELRQVSNRTNIFDFDQPKKSKRTFDRLKQAVDAIKRERENIENSIKVLKARQQKRKLTEDEIRELAVEESRIADLDKKFDSRFERYQKYKEEISDTDRDYYDRWANDNIY